MVETWFALVCVALTVFVVLDGVTIGAGIVQFAVAPAPAERRRLVEALGPLWSWNEVWLVAAGGTLALAFPRVLGIAFSGFYLALWLVLWSLVLRGVSLEIGGHVDDPLWRSAWDFVFTASSVLLAILFGTAIGAVTRGVPLDPHAGFSLSLFTDFRPSGHVGLIDWYTLSTAGLTTALLAAHGATALTRRLEDGLRARSVRAARRLWCLVAILLPVVSLETWIVRPDLVAAAVARPGALLGMLTVAAGAALLWTDRHRFDRARALAGSVALITGLLATAAVGSFPVMLRSTLAPEYSLTAHAGASPAPALAVGLWWWPLAAGLAVVYAIAVSRAYTARTRR